MNLKTFQSESMAGALKLVKAELGPGAVILHTRTFRRGGWLGLRQKNVVEITASNDVNIVPPKLRREVLSEARGTAAPGSARLMQQTYRTSSAGTAVAAPPATPSISTIPAHARGEDPALTEEIRQIRRMVTRMMKSQAAAIVPDAPDQLFNQYLALLEQEVTAELAEEVINKVRSRLSPQQLADAAAVKAEVGREIAALIPSDPTALRKVRPADGRPLTIALVGPTGVGKTTTLAKLAATFKLRDKKKVALITIDTFRIAAVDQLRTYANIINLPLHVVLSPQEMTEALHACRDFDVVLIDTAGRSQRDSDKLDDLREFIDSAEPHEVHLVLSSTCAQQVLDEAVDRFSRIRIDRIIFTKLDEAVSFGVLLNVVRRVNKQLSYVTTGQEVPHQIEAGQSDRLAGLILGQRL